MVVLVALSFGCRQPPAEPVVGIEDTDTDGATTIVPPTTSTTAVDCGLEPLPARPEEARASSFRSCPEGDWQRCDVGEACEWAVEVSWTGTFESGDQKCHRLCYDGECAAGESCVLTQLYGSDNVDSGLFYDPLCQCTSPPCEVRGPGGTPWPPEGGIAPWRPETPPPDLRQAAAVATDAYVIVSGGIEASAAASSRTDAVRAAPRGPDGVLGAWSSSGTLRARLEEHAMAVREDRVYVLGGEATDGSVADVQSAVVGADGALGAWRTEQPLPAPRRSHHAAAGAGVLVVAGGTLEPEVPPVPTDSVWWAELDADGVVGAWSEGVAPRELAPDAGIAIAYGRLFVVTTDARTFSIAVADLAAGDWTSEPSYDWPSPELGDEPDLDSLRVLSTCDALLFVRRGGHAVTQPILAGGALGLPRVASPIYGARDLAGFSAAAAPDGQVYVIGGGSDADVPPETWSTRRE